MPTIVQLLSSHQLPCCVALQVRAAMAGRQHHMSIMALSVSAFQNHFASGFKVGLPIDLMPQRFGFSSFN
jgi:hypothetical protein